MLLNISFHLPLSNITNTFHTAWANNRRLKVIDAFRLSIILYFKVLTHIKLLHFFRCYFYSVKSYYTKRAFIVIVCTTLLFGCKDWLLPAAVIIGLLNIDPDDNPENIIENCEHPIQSSSDVLFVADRIAKSIEYGVEQLDPGVYSEEKVTCYSGTITISGVLSRTEDEPCDAGCTRSYNDHNLIATLSDCIYLHPTLYTQKYSINGDVVLSNSMGIEKLDDGTTTPFGDYMMTDNGTEIMIEAVGYQCDNVRGEIVDTISSLNAYAPANYLSKYISWDTVAITTKVGTYSYSINQ